MNELNYSTNVSELLSSDHAVVYPFVKNISNVEYLKVIGSVIGASNIHSIYRNDNFVKVYLKSKDLVSEVIKSGIKVQGFKPLVSLNRTCCSVVLSRVDPTIPSDFIENLLQYYGTLKSPLKRLKLTNNGDFSHVISSDIRVTMEIFPGILLPPCLKFTHDGISYQIKTIVRDLSFQSDLNKYKTVITSPKYANPRGRSNFVKRTTRSVYDFHSEDEEPSFEETFIHKKSYKSTNFHSPKTKSVSSCVPHNVKQKDIFSVVTNNINVVENNQVLSADKNDFFCKSPSKLSNNQIYVENDNQVLFNADAILKENLASDTLLNMCPTNISPFSIDSIVNYAIDTNIEFSFCEDVSSPVFQVDKSNDLLQNQKVRQSLSSSVPDSEDVVFDADLNLIQTSPTLNKTKSYTVELMKSKGSLNQASKSLLKSQDRSSKRKHNDSCELLSDSVENPIKKLCFKKSNLSLTPDAELSFKVIEVVPNLSSKDDISNKDRHLKLQQKSDMISETSTKSNLSTSSLSGLRNGLQNVKTNGRDFCILTNNSKALKVNKKKSCSKNVAVSNINKDILKNGLISDETIKPKSLEQNKNHISSVNGDPVQYVSYTASLESDNDNIECQELNLENLATKRSISKSARFFSKKAQNSNHIISVNNSNKFMINCNAETLNENSIRKVSCDKDLNGRIFKVLPGKDQSEISQSFVESINKNTDVKTRKTKRYWYKSAKTKNSKITSGVNLAPNVEHKSEALIKSTQNVVSYKPLVSSPPNTNSNVGVTLEDNSLIEILKDNQLEKNLSTTKEKVEVTKMRKIKRKRKWNKSSSLKQYKRNVTVKPSKNCKPELNLNIDINSQNVFENTNCSSNCTQLNSSEKIESLIIKTNENFNNESESLKSDVTSVIFIPRESSCDGHPSISRLNLDNSSQENEETLGVCELSCQTEAILSEKTDSNMKAITSQEVEITSLVSSKRNDKGLENNTEILNHEEDITSNKENFKVSYDEHSDCTLKKTKFDEIGDQEMLVQIDVSDSIGSTIDNCINMQTPDVEEFNLSNLGKNCEKILAKYKMSPNLSNSIDSNNLDNSSLIVSIKESVSNVANNINKGQRCEQPMSEKDSRCSSLMVNCEEIPKSCKIFKSPSKNSNSKKLNDLNITISSDDGCEEFDFSLPENTINEIESYLLVDLPNNVQQFDENIDTDATKNEILNTKILKNKENDVINASKSNDKALSETALPPNDVSFNAERLDTSENVASCVDSNVCDKNNFPNLTISNGENDIDCYVMVHSPSTFLNANTSPRNLNTSANNTAMNGEVVGISSSTINEKVTSNSGLSKSANSSNTAVEDVLETIVSSVTPNDSPNDLIRNSVPSLIISDVSNKALDKVENRVDCFVKVHELSPLLSADSTTEDMTDENSIKSSAESVLLNSVNILDDQHASCKVNSSDSTTQPDIAEKIDFSITSSDSPCDLNENSVPSSLISDIISNNVDCHVMVHDPLVSSSADTTIMNDGDNVTIISKESGLNFPIDSDKQASNTKLNNSDDHLKATRFDVLGKVTSPFSLDEGPSITISDTITNSEMDPDVDCYVTVQDILPSLREVSSDINLNSAENVSGEANLNELQIKISSLSSLSTSQPESNFETISCNSTPFENMTGQFVAMEETAIIKQEYIEPDEQVPNPLLNPVTLKEDRPSPSKSMTINLDSEHNKKKVAALHAYIEQIKMRKKIQSKKLTKKAKAICSVNNNNLTPSPYDFDETQEETTSLKSLRVNKFKKTNLQSPVKKKPKLPCVVLFKDKNNFRGKWKVKMKMRDQDEVPVHNLVSSTSQTVTKKKNFSNKKVSKSLSLERNPLKIKAKNSTNKPASSSSILNNSNKFKIIDSVNIISEHIEAEPQNSVSESYMNFNSECVSKVIENDISSSSESHSDTFSPDSVSCESNISTVINSSLLNENESASCSSQIFETYVAKVEEVKPVYEDIYSSYNQVCDVSDSDDEKTVPNFPLRREKLVNFMNEVKRHRNPRTYALKVLSNNKTPGSLTALIVQLYEYFKACKSRTKRLRISRLIRALDDRYSRC